MSASYARDPVPAAPRGIARVCATAGAVYPVAVSLRRSGPATPCERSRTRRTRLRNPHQRCGLPAFGRLVVGGSAACVGSAQTRVGARAFPHPAGPSAARSHARIRETPRTSTPGAVAAESHRRGYRPALRARSVSHQAAPDERRGVTPAPPRSRCGQEAQNRNIAKDWACRPRHRRRVLDLKGHAAVGRSRIAVHADAGRVGGKGSGARSGVNPP